MSDEHAEIVAKGIIGVGFNVLALITSAQEEVEWWLRIVSLLIGCAVGLLTIYSFVRKFRRKP